MSDERPHAPSAAESGRPARQPAEPEWRRKRRLAAVFGDVLPETTADERDPEQASQEATTDRWLRGEVPPHHG